jgi:dihydrofolate reductase
MIWEMIVAVDKNDGIAKNRSIPWKSSGDMKFFKEKTQDNIVVMGKTTYFSLPERNRPLKNRENYVLTTTPEKYTNIELHHPSLHFINNIENIKEDSSKKVFLIGGQQLYYKFSYLCDVIWLTRIKKDYDCDLFLDLKFLDLNYKLETIVEENEEYIICKFVKT